MAVLDVLWAWVISILPVIFNWFVIAGFTLGVYAVLYTIIGLFDLYERKYHDNDFGRH